MCWSQSYSSFQSDHKKNPLPSNPPDSNLINTIVKNQHRTNHAQNYDQIKTPNTTQYYPKKALVFLGNNRSKHLFPLYRDQQIGIMGQFQRKVHHSAHDDDKMTTTTQLGLAISQTCQDLYEVLNNQDKYYDGSFTQEAGYSRGSRNTQKS